jgi:hypothetical protein
MLLFYRYQVLSDGCLIDNDNGRIITPLTKRKKKEVAPHHLVRDDNGNTHFFSVKFLMDKLDEGYEELTEIELPEDYEPIVELKIKEGQSMSNVVLEDILGDL